MNATRSHPPVLNRMYSLSHNVRIRTRTHLDMLAHANMLRITTQEFYAGERCIRQARAMLTQVVAEKIRLRSYLGINSPNALSAASQQYDVLHAYEQRLLSYLKQAGLELQACLARLNTLKAEPYAEHASQALRISELRSCLQVIGAQQHELTTELLALLQHEQPAMEMLEHTGENPIQLTSHYQRIASRLRQWMPVH